MRKYLHILLILLILFYCNDSNKKNNAEVIDILLDSLSNVDVTSDSIIGTKEFIKLETTPACLINEIKKIEFMDSTIVIQDMSDNLFTFNRTGKFIAKLGRKGGAKNEFIRIFDFYTDENLKEVSIIDDSKSKILHYSVTGKFLSTEPIPLGLISSFSCGMVKLDNDTFLSINCNFKDSKSNYSIINIKTKECKDVFDFMHVSSELISYEGVAKVSKANKRMFVITDRGEALSLADALES